MNKNRIKLDRINRIFRILYFLPFLKKDKKLYSSPRKSTGLKRSPIATMILKNYLGSNQAIVFRRRRIEFPSFWEGRKSKDKSNQSCRSCLVRSTKGVCFNYYVNVQKLITLYIKTFIGRKKKTTSSLILTKL